MCCTGLLGREGSSRIPEVQLLGLGLAWCTLSIQQSCCQQGLVCVSGLGWEWGWSREQLSHPADPQRVAQPGLGAFPPLGCRLALSRQCHPVGRGVLWGHSLVGHPSPHLGVPSCPAGSAASSEVTSERRMCLSGR